MFMAILMLFLKDKKCGLKIISVFPRFISFISTNGVFGVEGAHQDEQGHGR